MSYPPCTHKNQLSIRSIADSTAPDQVPTTEWVPLSHYETKDMRLLSHLYLISLLTHLHY